MSKIDDNRCTIIFNKLKKQMLLLRLEEMKIVGQVSTTQEAREIEFITKSFVVGNRARELGLIAKKQGVKKHVSQQQ